MATPRELILASTSPYRRELLARLGVSFRALAPACDEDAFKAQGLAPEALAETLALAKAKSLQRDHPAAVIIGSDQVAAVDDEILGNPGSEVAAHAQTARLAGRTHRLITAVAVVHQDRVLRHTDIARLTMRPLSQEQIERYVAIDTPIDCAGAYKLERAGIALFSRIESADYTAIVGLPLLALTAMLSQFGFEIP